MKKIMTLNRINYDIYIFIYDSTNYLIIKDNQYIDDKYIDYLGNRFNTYKKLEDGDILIKCLYFIKFKFNEKSSFYINFENQKFYDHIEVNKNLNLSKEIRAKLNSNKSIIKFESMKFFIIKIFSMSAKI